MVAPVAGFSASARAASSFGGVVSLTVRHTRLGTLLPDISIFSQTFFGFAGFAG
ncbi:MAG TPA: hypothetical protein VJM13_16225 [Sphingopyxis sp.]|nr:hypothetical protein [Sphingopyxis sp.]